jgi:cytochrome c-type biogenesis protein CcmH
VKARILLAAMAAVFSMAAAADPSERLPDPAQEARARHIFQQVRCLVCQNESIDDSQAELARDLRHIVRDQIRAGRSDGEVKRFLVDRYGEFVLLRPSFSLGNAALWGGPFLVVLFGLALLIGRLRSRNPEPEAELDAADSERLRRLQDGPS